VWTPLYARRRSQSTSRRADWEKNSSSQPTSLAAVKWLRFPRTLGIVVCLYLLGMSGVFGVLTSRNYRFIHDARQIPGTVIALVPRAPLGSTREPRAGERRTSLAPTVQYQVNGKTYTYTAAQGHFRQRVKIGDHLTVLCDPKDPADAQLKGEGRLLVPGITASFAISALLVAFILFRTRNLGIAGS
jgi:uncharacterized protein DUF3592